MIMELIVIHIQYHNLNLLITTIVNIISLENLMTIIIIELLVHLYLRNTII